MTHVLGCPQDFDREECWCDLLTKEKPQYERTRLVTMYGPPENQSGKVAPSGQYAVTRSAETGRFLKTTAG